MADPFQEYRDLIWGTGPYAADDPSDGPSTPGNSSSQDESAPSLDSSALPPTNVGILGPLIAPNVANAPQDQSAAFLDPSALRTTNVGILGRIPPPVAQDEGAAFLDPSTLQQSTKVGLGPVTPPGAMTVATANRSFDAPIGTNFHNEYRAGQYIGAEPIAKQFGDIQKAIGYGGTFDYQRMGGHFNPDFRDATNFGVGVLMRGAGHSWPATALAASLYATYHGRPDIIPHDLPLWGAGYDAAAKGQLPKGQGR